MGYRARSLGRSLARPLARSQLFKTLSHLWPYMRPEKVMLGLAFAATLGLTLVELSMPILIGMFVDSLLSQMQNRPDSTPAGPGQRTILALLAVAAVGRGYFLYQQRSLAGQAGQRVTARMRNAVWTHLQRLPIEYSERRGPGRLLVRFISDSKAIQSLVSRRLVQLIQDVLVVAGVMAVLIYFDFVMGLAALVMLPLVALVFWRWNPKLQDASRDTRRRRVRLSAHLEQRIGGLSAVKAHGRESRERKRVEKLNRRVAEEGARQEVAGGKLLGGSAGAVALVTVLAMSLASVEVAAGRLSAGELVTFYTLIGLLAPVFQRVTITDRTLQQAEISVQRLAQVLSEEPEDSDGDLPELEVSDGVVCVEGVSFEYPDGTPALRDVSFEARRGELVAIAGPNGSGKSTLLDLLSLFRRPKEGRITIDGQDATGVSPASLRSQVGLATTSTPLFDGTLYENVAYGARGEDPEEQVRRAAEISGVDELVESLPDGWDTKLRAGKRDLSRGERLRVVLARTLAAEPPVILLDEVDSVLSPQALTELARDKTVIAVTGGALLGAADRVYSLERITMEGNSAATVGAATDGSDDDDE